MLWRSHSRPWSLHQQDVLPRSAFISSIWRRVILSFLLLVSPIRVDTEDDQYADARAIQHHDAPHLQVLWSPNNIGGYAKEERHSIN